VLYANQFDYRYCEEHSLLRHADDIYTQLSTKQQ